MKGKDNLRFTNKIAVYLVFSGLILTSCFGFDTKKDSNSAQENTPEKPELVNHVETLDNMLHETSGLIHYRGKLWTINDSGNDPVLFALEIETGRVLQGILIENAENADWEALAQDDQHIYICDVGNNFGRRQELTIYKVAKKSIPASGSAKISAEIIQYQYAERPENNNPHRNSAYDCEAAFISGKDLYLFTKDWVNKTSTLYTCPTTPGSYNIQPRKTFPVNGLITGGDINHGDGSIVLCGYRKDASFIWVYKDFDPSDFSHGESLNYEYPEPGRLQNEGIAIASPERVYMSSEMNEFPAAIHRLDLGSILK